MSKQVIVNLTALNGKILPPRRTLILTPARTTIPVGRASKILSKGLTGGDENAWFDSPVMSRDHAEIKFNPDAELLTIQDIGSMHGTYVNSIQLPPDECQVLQNEDMLVFGAEVRRGADTYPACTFQVHYELAPYRASNTYKFPDSSDIEEGYDISDDDIDGSSQAPGEDELSSNNPIQGRDAIDLTRDDSLPGNDDSPSSVTLNRHSTIFIETDDAEGHFSSEPYDDSDVALSDCSSFGGEDLKEDVNELFLSHLRDRGSDGSVDDDKSDFSLSEAGAAGVRALFEDGLLSERYSSSWAAPLKDNYALPEKPETTWDFGPSNESGKMLAQDALPVSDSKTSDQHRDKDNLALQSDQLILTSCGIARQPSPSDAAMVKTTVASISQQPLHKSEGLEKILNPIQTPTPSINASQHNTAETLGEKSGKHAFFAARECNKAQIRGTGNGLFGYTKSLAQVKQDEKTRQTPQADFWSPSADRHTSIKWDIPLPSMGVPELDMTSAAKYNESKASMLAAINKPFTTAPARPGLSINDILDDSTSTTVRERKRKADNISDDVEAEVRMWASSTIDTSNELGRATEGGSNIARAEPSDNSPAPVAEGLGHRPAKKLKKFVEAIGYVALGGAAVGAGMFSLLVATAPDFL